MDALSEVLRSFRLQSSFRSAFTLTSPWGLSFLPARAAMFHHVRAGAIWLETYSGARARVEAGDVVVLFDGTGHRIADRLGGSTIPIERLIARHQEGEPLRYGGGGRVTELVCGNFVIDERDSLAGSLPQLPPLVHLRGGTRRRAEAFTSTLALLASELGAGEQGSDRAAVLLTEMLFIHVLRAVLAEHWPDGAGWLQGLRDPAIGPTLGAIHTHPDREWSLAALARVAGVSRSVLAQRFHDRVGVPPMAYLTRWRLELAARWLREPELSVTEVVQRVGYGSLAAFHRAFKRSYGVSPTRYRARESEPEGNPTEQRSRRGEATAAAAH